MHEPTSTTLPDSGGDSGTGTDRDMSAVSLPTVAIVGRPNVGKSTFFNRIVGGRPAIVDSQPGVTRDVHFAEAEWGGRRFYVVDTGGILEKGAGEIDQAVRRQALAAMETADLLVFMVDGREGLHPLDQHIAELLRRQQTPVLLVVNKMDRLPDTTEHLEFYALGLGDPAQLSAASGRGSGDLLDRVAELLPAEKKVSRPDSGLRVSIIGRPNVGKSSYINKLLGTDRLVVSREAGTTRDAIDTPCELADRKFVFIDTAGLRRKSRVSDGLEYYAMVRTLSAIDRSDVCLLLADAEQGVSNQDFRIGRMAWDKGRGLVLAINKWDLVEKETNTAVRFERDLRKRVPFLDAVPIVFISALTGQRVSRALDLVWQVGEERKKRVPTHELNEGLQRLTDAVQPPHHRGRPIRFYYATQVKTAPPVFALFANYPREVPENYTRYLMNGFRKAWGFTGSPIRLKFRARRKERA